MKLLLDIGNSRAKWAWLEGRMLTDPGVIARDGDGADRLVDRLRTAGHMPDTVLVASVAGAAASQAFGEALAKAFGVPVRMAQTETQAAGVTNGYQDPRQLGVDRWLAMLAAYSRLRSPVCVVDAGTALTIDAVAADGTHRGGLIIPGMALMRESLMGGTAGIAAATRLVASPGPAGEFWGRDTAACVRGGAKLAAVYLIEGCITALRQSASGDIGLVLTGGEADWLCDALSVRPDVRPLLVLEGLALRYGDEAN